MLDLRCVCGRCFMCWGAGLKSVGGCLRQLGREWSDTHHHGCRLEVFGGEEPKSGLRICLEGSSQDLGLWVNFETETL